MGKISSFLYYAWKRKRSPEDYLAFQRYQGKLIKEELENHRILKKGMRILDVGSGIGGYVYELGKTTEVEIVSLDKNPLGVAIERYRKLSKGKQGMKIQWGGKKGKIVFNSRRIAVVEGDITNAPFKDESFDIILASGVIEHVKDQEKMIEECHRLLKNDGLLYLSFPPFYSPVGGHSISPLHYIPGKFPFWLYKRKTEKEDPSFKYYGLYKTTIRSVKKKIKNKFVIKEERARVFDFLKPVVKIPILCELVIHHVEFFLEKRR